MKKEERMKKDSNHSGKVECPPASAMQGGHDKCTFSYLILHKLAVKVTKPTISLTLPTHVDVMLSVYSGTTGSYSV